MQQTRTIPNITEIVTPLLGLPYAEMDCWNLVRHLYQQGFGIDLARQGEASAQRFQEVWSQRDATDPLPIAQPWDLVVSVQDLELPVSRHVGVVVDGRTFVHARESATGVAMGRLRTWKPYLFQLARLRELL